VAKAVELTVTFGRGPARWRKIAPRDTARLAQTTRDANIDRACERERAVSAPAATGPALVTVMVYVSGAPAYNGSAGRGLTMDRSPPGARRCTPSPSVLRLGVVPARRDDHVVAIRPLSVRSP